MKLSSSLSSVAIVAASVVNAQQSWKEPTSNVTYTFAIPDTASVAPYDMLVSIDAPLKAGWAGWAAGGCMLRSPILVAWANGTGVAVSPRWAS
jgi:cellobiose dehydrogenase (acceptor)